jgi:hypothetical protein
MLAHTLRLAVGVRPWAGSEAREMLGMPWPVMRWPQATKDVQSGQSSLTDWSRWTATAYDTFSESRGGRSPMGGFRSKGDQLLTDIRECVVCGSSPSEARLTGQAAGLGLSDEAQSFSLGMPWPVMRWPQADLSQG